MRRTITVYASYLHCVRYYESNYMIYCCLSWYRAYHLCSPFRTGLAVKFLSTCQAAVLISSSTNADGIDDIKTAIDVSSPNEMCSVNDKFIVVVNWQLSVVTGGKVGCRMSSWRLPIAIQKQTIRAEIPPVNTPWKIRTSLFSWRNCHHDVASFKHRAQYLQRMTWNLTYVLITRLRIYA